MTSHSNLVRFLLVSLVGCSVFASTNGWLSFSSSRKFSVLYPPEWIQSGTFTDRLQILSSEGGASGVIIKHGQAGITVMEAQKNSGVDLPQVIDSYTQGTSILSRRNIATEDAPDGCRVLREAISRERVIPAADSPIEVPYIINTEFFCGMRGRPIVTLLRNWQGDPRQSEYQHVALRMAQSIRSSE